MKIDYIGYSDNSYYEILKQKDTVEIVKYHLNKNKLQQDTLYFISLNEAKKELKFETLIKSKRLEKGWNHKKDTSLRFKVDTLYTFQFLENGNKELWYLSGNDRLEIYNRFWCKPKKQPAFISMHYEKFDVILVQRDMKLSLIYYDKKKGIQGNIRF